MNKNFVIYNATGAILRAGYCPVEDFILQAQEGEFIIEAQACCLKDAVNVETGEIICGGGTPQATPIVTGQPAALSSATQLDLLWQAMDAGTFPKAEPFYSAIKATKETST